MVLEKGNGCGQTRSLGPKSSKSSTHVVCGQESGSPGSGAVWRGQRWLVTPDRRVATFDWFDSLFAGSVFFAISLYFSLSLFQTLCVYVYICHIFLPDCQFVYGSLHCVSMIVTLCVCVIAYLSACLILIFTSFSFLNSLTLNGLSNVLMQCSFHFQLRKENFSWRQSSHQGS